MKEVFVTRFLGLTVLVLLLSLVFAPAVFAQQPVSDGFAIQTSVSTAPQSIDEELVGLYSMEGGLSVGYKIGGTILSLGFNFNFFNLKSRGNQAQITNPPADLYITEVSHTYYNFVLGPEVQFPIVRSADQRAELFGLMSVGVGTWKSVTTVTPDFNSGFYNEDGDTRVTVRWRVAPGLRYWLHSNIAVGLAAGITGEHRIFSDQEGDEFLHVVAFCATEHSWCVLIVLLCVYPQAVDNLGITCGSWGSLVGVGVGDDVDDNAAAFVACFDVSEGVGGSGEWVALVDNGLKFA